VERRVDRVQEVRGASWGCVVRCGGPGRGWVWVVGGQPSPAPDPTPDPAAAIAAAVGGAARLVHTRVVPRPLLLLPIRFLLLPQSSS
jgi:hypothetical protein